MYENKPQSNPVQKKFIPIYFLVLAARLKPIEPIGRGGVFSVPHLDLAAPVAGGGGGRQHRVLGHPQAGLSVGAQRVHHAGALVVVEVGGA